MTFIFSYTHFNQLFTVIIRHSLSLCRLYTCISLHFILIHFVNFFAYTELLLSGCLTLLFYNWHFCNFLPQLLYYVMKFSFLRLLRISLGCSGWLLYLYTIFISLRSALTCTELHPLPNDIEYSCVWVCVCYFFFFSYRSHACVYTCALSLSLSLQLSLSTDFRNKFLAFIERMLIFDLLFIAFSTLHIAHTRWHLSIILCQQLFLFNFSIILHSISTYTKIYFVI